MAELLPLQRNQDRFMPFFGPKGYWQINFDVPVLRWWLELNHNKNNDDPTWEQDYKHYEEVCQRLDRI